MDRVNKKEQVLHELGDIAKLLNINIDYVIDLENHREYLVCDETKICTNGTSIYGIREEFFGYVATIELNHRLNYRTLRYLKQYWYDDNFNQPFYMEN